MIVFVILLALVTAAGGGDDACVGDGDTDP